MLDEIFQNSNEPPAPPDRRSADIGIVCTYREEVRPLLKALDRLRSYIDEGAMFRGGFIDEMTRVAVVEAGPGFAAHRRATETLIAEHHPVWVLSVGFSSSLSPEVSAGDICLANEICDTHGNAVAIRCTIPESRRVFVRRHVVADQHPCTAEEKSRLTEATGAAVVDTTSAAVAQVCAETVDVPSTAGGSDSAGDDVVPAKPAPVKARFLSIRGIIDGAEESLSAEAVAYMFHPEPQKPNPVATVLKRFRRDPQRAAWDARVADASKNLNRYLLSVVRQIAERIAR